ncbi:hypothetical protein LNP18_06265 [Leuconostoc citreum]|uniref:hypothetical protein n=1 Tax=Leuconostoc citreum TaxID=33964 RepID=UPI00200AD879|nr:hypothetical protein [Leuconostoc citreum]MCK8605707.1 hypothetical protein [Leuconostoc citreum]
MTNKYQDTLRAEVPETVEAELILIDSLLENADVSEDVYRKQPRTVTIKNSRDEEWYFQQMLRWVEKNPMTVDGQLGRSTIYRFALHFFVENIALSSQNGALRYAQLLGKLNRLTVTKAEAKQNAQNKNIEDSLSFIMAMVYQQMGYMPESLKDNQINYQLNPMSEIEVQTIGTATELNDDTELSKSFNAYKLVRTRDKQRIKKTNQTKGVIFDD